MTNKINQFEAVDKEICSISSRLRNVADAFSITGNSIVSDELHRIANRVAFCRENIKDARNQLIDEINNTLKEN